MAKEDANSLDNPQCGLRISTPKLKESKNETLEQERKRSKWDNDNFICRGHILNGMNDSLFDVNQYHELARFLWEALEEKYMAEDASSKKFLVSNFNVYKMVDNPLVLINSMNYKG